ncbi:MAG: hypothetical protein ACJ8FY_17560 [Gemmataceae bacterium]
MFLFKDRRRVAVSGAIVLLCGFGLACWIFFRPDPGLVRAQELSIKLRENLPIDRRRELMRELRQTMEQLTPEQRRALAKDRRKEFEDRIAKYFTLPKEEQTAYLDAQINGMEEARRQRQRDNPSYPTSTRPNTRPYDAEERDRRRRDRLDQSTPEQRAEFAAFFQALRDRRQQRGLPGWGGGR